MEKELGKGNIAKESIFCRYNFLGLKFAASEVSRLHKLELLHYNYFNVNTSLYLLFYAYLFHFEITSHQTTSLAITSHPNTSFAIMSFSNYSSGTIWQYITWNYLTFLKGILSSNNPTILPRFSVFMNFHPKLSVSCSGLIIRLEPSQCCN